MYNPQQVQVSYTLKRIEVFFSLFVVVVINNNNDDNKKNSNIRPPLLKTNIFFYPSRGKDMKSFRAVSSLPNRVPRVTLTRPRPYHFVLSMWLGIST